MPQPAGRCPGAFAPLMPPRYTTGMDYQNIPAIKTEQASEMKPRNQILSQSHETPSVLASVAHAI